MNMGDPTAAEEKGESTPKSEEKIGGAKGFLNRFLPWIGWKEMHDDEQNIKLRTLCRTLSSFVTACSNFSAQYNFQSIAISLIIMSASQCTSDDGDCRDGTQKGWVRGSATGVIFFGAVMGQLTLGYLGDVIGRNVALVTTLGITCLSAVLSAAAPSGDATSVYAMIVVFRFFLGVGLGGIFPLTATKSSENTDDSISSSNQVNSKAASLSFFWQMPGAMCPWFIGYIVASTDMSTSAKWRTVLGMGAIPSFLAIVGLLLEEYIKAQADAWDTMMNEKSDSRLTSVSTSGSRSSKTSSFFATALSASTNSSMVPSGVSDESQMALVYRLLLTDVQTRRNLIASGGTWFLFDIVVYGLGLIAGPILDAIKSGDDDFVSSDQNIKYVCSRQLIALSLNIPGTILGVLAMPHLGLKWLQFFSFSFLALMLLILSSTFVTLKESNTNSLYATYCFSSMALNIGLGITTFSLPAALFPKHIRSTFNGIAAAMGKCGAVVGAYVMYEVAVVSSYPAALGMSSAIAVAAALVTLYFVDSSQLEVNSKLSLTSEKKNKFTSGIRLSSSSILILPANFSFGPWRFSDQQNPNNSSGNSGSSNSGSSGNSGSGSSGSGEKEGKHTEFDGDYYTDLRLSQAVQQNTSHDAKNMNTTSPSQRNGNGSHSYNGNVSNPIHRADGVSNSNTLKPVNFSETVETGSAIPEKRTSVGHIEL